MYCALRAHVRCKVSFFVVLLSLLVSLLWVFTVVAAASGLGVGRVALSLSERERIQ